MQFASYDVKYVVNIHDAIYFLIMRDVKNIIIFKTLS